MNCSSLFIHLLYVADTKTEDDALHQLEVHAAHLLEDCNQVLEIVCQFFATSPKRKPSKENPQVAVITGKKLKQEIDYDT